MNLFAPVSTGSYISQEPKLIQNTPEITVNKFSDFIGQTKQVTLIKEAINSALIENRPIDHTLFLGSAGHGKTSLAYLMSKESKRKILFLTGGSLSKPIDVYAVFKNIKGGKFPIIFIDECLTGDSLIVKKDGAVYKIEDIVKNDNLFLGGKTSNLIKRKSDSLLRFHCNDGNIITTRTHSHVVIDANSKKVSIKKAKNLTTNNYLIVPKFIPHEKKNNITINQAKFVALLISDGCITRGKYKDQIYESSIQFSWSLKNRHKLDNAIEICKRALPEFGIDLSRMHVSVNRDFVLRINDTSKIKEISSRFNIFSGKRKKANTDIVNDIFYSDINSIRAFIDTVIFYEGWSNGVNEKHIQMSSKTFIYKFQLLLKKIGIASSVYEYVDRKHNTNFYRLSISGKLNNRKTIIFNNMECYMSKIRKIDTIENNTTFVYDFTTETHIFTANGFITHNCHALPKAIAELFYVPMERPNSEIVIPKSSGFRATSITVPPLTMVGATMGEQGKIPRPMLDRFGLKIMLTDYSKEECLQIARNSAKRMGLNIEKECLEEIIYRTFATPRIINSLLCRVRDHVVSNKLGYIGMDTLAKVFDLLSIDKYGLDEKAREILRLLSNMPNGKAGMSVISTMCGIDAYTLRQIYEPKLVRLGFMVYHSSGRILTEEGYRYIGGK